MMVREAVGSYFPGSLTLPWFKFWCKQDMKLRITTTSSSSSWVSTWSPATAAEWALSHGSSRLLLLLHTTCSERLYIIGSDRRKLEIYLRLVSSVTSCNSWPQHARHCPTTWICGWCWSRSNPSQSLIAPQSPGCGVEKKTSDLFHISHWLSEHARLRLCLSKASAVTTLPSFRKPLSDGPHTSPFSLQQKIGKRQVRYTYIVKYNTELLSFSSRKRNGVSSNYPEGLSWRLNASYRPEHHRAEEEDLVFLRKLRLFIEDSKGRLPQASSKRRLLLNTSTVITEPKVPQDPLVVNSFNHSRISINPLA